MRKTFDEIIVLFMIDNDIDDYFDLTYSDTKRLMKLVREKTLIEVANYAEADYNIINSNIKEEYFKEEQIEVYVLKESIIQLDKNTVYETM